uniref:Claudin 1 n=1 Tax=Sarcophilus harrisii TaxID=9305 RepID=G3VDR8_SARHA
MAIPRARRLRGVSVQVPSEPAAAASPAQQPRQERPPPRRPSEAPLGSHRLGGGGRGPFPIPAAFPSARGPTGRELSARERARRGGRPAASMANAGLQLLGFILAFLGWIGTIVSTAMPQWKISSYAGDNIVTAQAIYEGLWMSCVSQSTGQIQCKVFDSLLNLSSTLQATRALMVIGIIVGLIAIFVATVGMKCMKCMEDDEVQKMRMAVFGGVIFLVSGLAVLVATAWYGNRVAREFYDPMTPVNSRYEFGQALFIGWAAASLCLLGGALLCCSCPKKTTSYPTPRPYPKTTPSSGKDYV